MRGKTMAEKKHTGLKITIGVIIVLAVLGVIGALSSTPTQTSQAITRAAQGDDLVMDGAPSVVSDGGLKYLVGKVKNNSTNKEYGYVQVEFGLYDKDKALVGSALANVNNLGPGQTWKYKAIIAEDSAATYELKGITGF
jgi:hypothetical protein